jgi:hypothetical protein
MAKVIQGAFHGHGLNTKERLAVDLALHQLSLQQQCARAQLCFWGKVSGSIRDYYVIRLTDTTPVAVTTATATAKKKTSTSSLTAAPTTTTNQVAITKRFFYRYGTETPGIALAACICVFEITGSVFVVCCFYYCCCIVDVSTSCAVYRGDASAVAKAFIYVYVRSLAISTALTACMALLFSPGATYC